MSDTPKRSRMTHRTYLLRGGPFNGLRVTCQRHNRPGAIVLFENRISDPITDMEGDLYELDADGVEYVMDEGEPA